MKTASQTTETSSVITWIKGIFDCYEYDDGIDSDFLADFRRRWKRCNSDPAKLAQQWVIDKMKSEGYHQFDRFGFLNTFLKEGFSRTDWETVGNFICKYLNL
jgi:hypothetical protein